MQKRALLMHERDQGALAIRNIGGEQYIGRCSLTGNPLDQIIETFTGLSREQHGLRIPTAEAQAINAIEQIDFIEHRQRQTLAGSNLIEHAINRLELTFIVLIRCIHDLENQVGTKHL